MTHALVALASAAMTAYVLIPTTVAGGYHFGLFVMAMASGLAAILMDANK